MLFARLMARGPVAIGRVSSCFVICSSRLHFICKRGGMSGENPAGISHGSEKDDPNHRASEELKARVIAAYEQAVHYGLRPGDALAVMLDWASEECARIREDFA